MTRNDLRPIALNGRVLAISRASNDRTARPRPKIPMAHSPGLRQKSMMPCPFFGKNPAARLQNSCITTKQLKGVKMHKAGGIIGLIAGLLAVGAALFTLLMGGAGAAFDATGHDRIIAYGWWGVGAAFMVIAFGAVAIFNAAVGAFGLLAFSIVGAILGGSIVGIALSLALLGGFLAAAGSKKWWPLTGLLAGLAVAAPILSGMGDPRELPQPATVAPPSQSTAQEVTEVTEHEADLDSDTTDICGHQDVQDAVKEDFLNELMITGYASSYARQWGLIGKGESIDARLASDMHRLLPMLNLNGIASRTTSTECIATLVFGPHTQYPIHATYKLFPLANEAGVRVDSVFVLPESGMAQVNLFQGMQKGVLNALYESDIAAMKAREAARESTPADMKNNSSAPSFDCTKAQTNVEIMICNSSSLSRSDAAMAQLHKAARLQTSDVWAFDAMWREWLMLRDGCTSVACLEASYAARIAELQQK